MKKSKGIVSLVLIAALLGLLGFTCWQGFGSSHTGSARNINLGLDLAGGVSITYQAKDKNPSAEDMKDTIYKLQKRVEQYSTEASVYQEGDDRINIEIPGVSDANKVLEELGKPGSLVFQDADGNTVLEGTDVKNAEAQTQENSTTKNKEYVVALQLTKEGTTKFAEATAANVGKQISIIYDGQTISSPRVNQAIEGGEAVITGMSSYEEADNLAATIRIGGLSLELEELRSNVWCHRTCHHLRIYVLRISASGTCSRSCTSDLYRTDPGAFKCIQYHAYPSGYCRYYSWNRYGGGCQRYHFRPCA